MELIRSAYWVSTDQVMPTRELLQSRCDWQLLLLWSETNNFRSQRAHGSVQPACQLRGMHLVKAEVQVPLRTRLPWWTSIEAVSFPAKVRIWCATGKHFEVLRSFVFETKSVELEGIVQNRKFPAAEQISLSDF